MKRRILSIVLTLALCLGLLPGTVWAAEERETRTEPLILTETAAENAAQGWSWELISEGCYTLTLDNVDFEVESGNAIEFQISKSTWLGAISIVLKGENHIVSTGEYGIYHDSQRYRAIPSLTISGGSLDLAGNWRGIYSSDIETLNFKDTTVNIRSGEYAQAYGILLDGRGSMSIENSTVRTDRIKVYQLDSQNSRLTAEAYGGGYGRKIIETTYFSFSGGKLTVSGPEDALNAYGVYCGNENGMVIPFSNCRIDIRNVEQGIWNATGNLRLQNVTGTVFTTKSAANNSIYQNAAFYSLRMDPETHKDCHIFAQTGQDVVHTFLYGDYAIDEDTVWSSTGVHIQEGCSLTVAEGKKLTFTKDVTIHGNYESGYVDLVNNGTLEFMEDNKVSANLINNGTLLVSGFLECAPENFTNNGTFNGHLDDSRWQVFGNVQIRYKKTLGKWTPTSYWSDTIHVTDQAVLTILNGKTLDASQSEKGITADNLQDYLSVAETGRIVIEEGGTLLLPPDLPQEKLDTLRLSGAGTVKTGDVEACKVKFMDGGADIAVKFVILGGSAVLSDNPEKDGFTLVWCEDAAGEKPFDFDAAVTEDLTLYAKWIRNIVPIVPSDTVRYIVEHYRADASGGTGYVLAGTESPAGTIGATVTAEPKTYDGFIYNAEKSTASGTLVRLEDADDIVTLRLYYDVAPAVTGVTIDQTSLALAEGKSGQLTAQVRPANAGKKTVTWTSSDPTVAAVDAGGKVTALKAGEAAITASVEGGFTAICTVTVNPVADAPVRPPELADTEAEKFKVEVETGLSTVPAGLINEAGVELTTPELVETELRAQIKKVNAGIPEENTAVYDVELMVSRDGGDTWIPATEDNFPEVGHLTVTLPYPAGTHSGYTFRVVHMFTGGANAGRTEAPAVTNTAAGIQFQVTGLSPISVGWTAPPAGGGDDDDSSSSPSRPTVTIGGDRTGGKAEAGRDSVTITPEDGYQVAKITVNGKEVSIPAGNKLTGLKPTDRVVVTFEKIPAPVTVPVSWRFPDVAEGAWYEEAVQFAVDKGLFYGTAPSAFEPESPMTRGMLVTVLYRLAGRPESTVTGLFSDVADGEYYAPAIAWAASRGVAHGYGNGLFGPNDPITREQLAAMLYRYEQTCGGGFTGNWMFLLDFTDQGAVNEWAYEAMCWMTMNHVVEGKSSKILDPQGQATRAEAAAMLQLYIQVAEKYS